MFLSVRVKGFATFFDFCDNFGADISMIAQIVVNLQKYEHKFEYEETI